MNQKQYYVYIMTNITRKFLYVGITKNLKKRVHQHKQRNIYGVTRTHNCTNLVYYESLPSLQHALAREKQLAKWNRAKKNRLVCEMNPNWADLERRLSS